MPLPTRGVDGPGGIALETSHTVTTASSIARAVDSLKALADQNRIRIVEMLSQREMCAIELLGQLEISQPTLSHHMKVLALASIVRTRKTGAQVFYTVNRERLAELSALLGRLGGDEAGEGAH